MPRPKGCKCGVLKPGEFCPVHPSKDGSWSEADEQKVRRAERAFGTPKPKRKPDPSPKPGGRRPTSSRRRARDRPTDKQLEDGLRKTLKLCSLPMRFKCDYCAEHMSATAAIAAAKAIEDHDLRELVERVSVWCDQYAGAGWLVVFFGVPLVHHVAPEFIYRPVAPLVGMPPRPRKPSKTAGHGHPHPEPTGTPATPPEQAGGGGGNGAEPVSEIDLGMFAGMDLDQVLDTARTLGIEVSDEELANLTEAINHAATATAPPEATVTAERSEQELDAESAAAAEAAALAHTDTE